MRALDSERCNITIVVKTHKVQNGTVAQNKRVRSFRQYMTGIVKKDFLDNVPANELSDAIQFDVMFSYPKDVPNNEIILFSFDISSVIKSTPSYMTDVLCRDVMNGSISPLLLHLVLASVMRHFEYTFDKEVRLVAYSAQPNGRLLYRGELNTTGPFTAFILGAAVHEANRLLIYEHIVETLNLIRGENLFHKNIFDIDKQFEKKVQTIYRRQYARILTLLVLVGKSRRRDNETGEMDELMNIRQEYEGFPENIYALCKYPEKVDNQPIFDYTVKSVEFHDGHVDGEPTQDDVDALLNQIEQALLDQESDEIDAPNPDDDYDTQYEAEYYDDDDGYSDDDDLYDDEDDDYDDDEEYSDDLI